MFARTSLSSPDAPPLRAHPPVRQLDALTSLRFFPALIVMVFHFPKIAALDVINEPIVSLGHTSVTFFFVLSGFIMSYNYANVPLTEKRHLVAYFIARVARIYPVYVISLILAAPFSILYLDAFWNLPLKIIYGSSLLLGPLGVHAWLPGAACFLNCPSWSVSAEILFYIVFPIALPIIYNNYIHSMIILYCIWALMMLGAAILWMTYGHGQPIMVVDIHNSVFAASAVAFFEVFSHNSIT